ncbi:Cytochrome P450 10 [Trichoplax sp. H2]|uniref:Cytochrome P450 n=1 Tax=Trichoplax adhaerens TaxID=10228 RepID=B3RWY4_TRIAD|nr:hypothetical protein TRIADDRAFT_56927 [Trichoplax adhaerens]EDV25213.1 hypothetical protein TRIADDRAFT_56927 [Trichoplax adhaerens]RDD44576.1 Cytochrome P450 10 [Trichoplax sp. H2]|eukprot:XP_002113103.1 hypothetical protein TRIADDRAFT_56927 [Trichoplax adhaerens]
MKWKLSVPYLQRWNTLYRQVSIRSATSTAIGSDTQVECNTKPFHQIPGPKGLPIIGDLMTFLRNDSYYLKRPHLLLLENTKKYGPIYKQKIFTWQTVVVTDPNEISKIYSAEGTYPTRGLVKPFIHHRMQSKRAKGIAVGDGKEWRKARSIIDKKLLKVKDVSAYAERMNDIITDFIRYIQSNKDCLESGEVEFRQYLYKWSFETINSVIYNKRLGTLNDPPLPFAQKFFNSVINMLEGTYSLLYAPAYYKYFKTRFWKKYCHDWDTLFEIGDQLVKEETQKLQKEIQSLGKDKDRWRSEELEFLPYVLLKEELSEEEVSANVVEIMGGGVDTSANTVLWALYILGKHPDIQEKLYNEVSGVLQNSKYPDAESVQNMPYLRGLVKEGQRIYPVIYAPIREIAKDAVLCGYHVPAKTIVVNGIYAMSFNPQIYDEPHKIKPERWARSYTGLKVNRFAHLPFGYGPRMCIGRRIAELEIHLLIARLISEFKIECKNKEEVGLISRLVLAPDANIQISFKKRT